MASESYIVSAINKIRSLLNSKKLIWLSFLPIIVVGIYIFRFGLNIPFWDQWAVTPLLMEKQQGTLSLADLFDQHNEHRPFFPRLIWITLSEFTNYNVNAELWFNFLIMICVFLFFIRQTANAWERSGVEWPPLFIPLLSLLVFNLGQYENWLQGFQTTVILAMACVVIGIFLLAENSKPTHFLSGMLLGVVATFSNANGLFYWPIGLGVLAFTASHRSRILKISVWLICSTVCIALFLAGWRSNGLDLGYLSTHFPDYFLFMLSFLGAPINTSPWFAWMFGCAGLGLFVLIIFHVIRTRNWMELVPYFGIILFALLTALSVSAGRLELGLIQARVSRYHTLSIWYWASLLTFLPMLRIKSIYKKLFCGVLAVSLMMLMYTGNINGQIGLYQRILPAYQAAASGQELSDELLIRIYPQPEAVRPRLEFLCENKLSVCAQVP